MLFWKRLEIFIKFLCFQKNPHKISSNHWFHSITDSDRNVWRFCTSQYSERANKFFYVSICTWKASVSTPAPIQIPFRIDSLSLEIVGLFISRLVLNLIDSLNLGVSEAKTANIHPQSIKFDTYHVSKHQAWFTSRFGGFSWSGSVMTRIKCFDTQCLGVDKNR